MSTQTVTKKRKSIGDATATTKKAKIAKSADMPAPVKSALKKPKEQKTKETKIPAVADKPAKVTKQKVTKKVERKEKKDAAPVTETIVEDTAATEGGAELTEDQTADLLAGFSSSEDEASDAEEDAGIAIEKLPQAPRMKDIQKRIKQATSDDPERTPGVLYVGRIPHGFYETQMRAYFSQFGEITHLRLARNRRTGKSQNYAFLEFASGAVAQIVAKTMDKYLLFNHILQVRIVPREQVKENMWKGAGARKKPAPRNKLEGGKLKRGMVKEDWDVRVQREAERRAEKAEKLKEMGYEFEMPALKSTSDIAAGDEEVVKLVKDAEENVEPETEVLRTFLAKPEGVTVMEKKTSKKASGGKKSKAAKK